jgi:hypothetical protein
MRNPLPFNDARHLQAHQFLVDEAYLLDAQQYEAWLDTLTDDVRYVMPVRVTTARGAGFDTSPGRGPRMAHFDEDKYSLTQRVARFATEHAWAEDPPSRLRHFITNVRTFECDDPDDGAHLIVESAAARTCCAGARINGSWPAAGSLSTSRCCACKTWRYSYERRARAVTAGRSR